jgi:hypothetical protein
MAGRLVTSTINDDTGVLAVQNGMRGIAKAWVNFNGTGTVAIRDSFNVSSITDNGTGYYTINFTTAMPNANYAVSGGYSASYASRYSGGLSLFTIPTTITETAPTTTSFALVTSDLAGNPFDPKYVTLAIFSS